MGEIVETLQIPTTQSITEMYKNMTVKFQLNNFHTVVQVYPNRLSLEEIKKDIGQKFKVDGKYLCLHQNMVNCSDALRLCDVERNDFGIIEFELKLNELAVEYNSGVLKGERLVLNPDVFYR